MNNFWKRAITGVTFVAAVLGLTFPNSYTFLTLLMVLSILGMHEFYRMVFNRKPGLPEYFMYLSGAALVCNRIWMPDGMQFHFLAIVFVIIAVGVLLNGQKSWKNILWYWAGFIYIAVPLALFFDSVFENDAGNLYSNDFYVPARALNLFILIWCSDTFAYLCGSAFGKHPLFKSISPRKTWEGFIGGALLTMTFSVLLAFVFEMPVSLNILIAFLTILFGTLGDLVESLLKREFNAKDSGSILPGHGGMLDRFDALLLSLPFTTLCYKLFL